MNVKKLMAGFLSMLTLTTLLGGSVMAAGTTTITVKGTGSEYKAYRLMDVEQALKGTCSHAEGEHTEDCYDWTYTENGKYADVITAAKAAAAAVKTNPMTSQLDTYPTDEFLRDMKSENTAAFEKKAWESLKTMEADAVSTTGEFQDVPTGWYFIAETKAGESPDYISFHMLNTAGKDDLVIQSKEARYDVFDFGVYLDPEHTRLGQSKEVKEGDTVTYRMYFDAFENFSTFSKLNDLRKRVYELTFHVAAAPGISINNSTDALHVFLGNDELSSKYRTVTVGEDGNSFDLTQVFTHNVRDLYAGKTGIFSIFSNTKTLVAVEFTGVVEDAAQFSDYVVASQVTFPNDPYDPSSTDKTPLKQTGLFRYTLNINTVDKGNQALSGAQYTLERKNGENWEPVMPLSDTDFTFKDLSSGYYRLKETAAPDTFGTVEDIYFTILPKYEGSKLTGLSAYREGDLLGSGEDGEVSDFITDIGTGDISLTVVHGHTTQLPATGAASLIVLLAAGAVMVAAGSADIIRRRNHGSV